MISLPPPLLPLVVYPELLVLAAVVGALIGSFLNVCIARWPLELSVIRPRSRCPRCGHQLSWYENVPVMSWLALRGRCRSCREAISVQYPLVELAVALLWFAAALWLGPTFTTLRLAVFATILLGVAITDAKHYVIPDGFTVFGLVWALGTAVVAFFLGGDTLFAGPYEALVGACAGAGLIAIVGWLGEWALKKEAMGFGDVTLMAMVGAALGPGRAILTVFLAAFLGSVVFLGVVYPMAWLRRRRRTAPQTELALDAGAPRGGVALPLVPFGVFLAPAALLALLWGNAMVEWLTWG